MPTVTFFISLFLLIIIFLNLGELTDNDSIGYQYFLKPDIQYADFYPSERPFIFPLYLFLIKNIGICTSLPVYLISNYILYCLSLCLLVIIVQKTTQSVFLAFISFILGFFNLQIVQHINYLNPEILLSFLVILHVYLLYNFYKKGSFFILFLIQVSYFLLTFTKPIFFLYPFINLPFILMTNRKFWKEQSCVINKTKKLFLVSICFLVLYLIPIHLWSLRNFMKNKIYSFSLIRETNLTGKIMQYGLIDKFPLDEQYSQLREALTKNGNYKDIYWRFPLIIEATPKDKNTFQFLGEFNEQVIKLNYKNYILKSLTQIPIIITKIPLDKDYPYYYLNINLNQKIWIFYLIYQFLWSIISKIYLLIILLILISSIYSILNKNFWYLSILLVWGYMIAIISFAAYDSFTRLRTPVDALFIILFIIGLFNCYKFIQHQTIKLSK